MSELDLKHRDWRDGVDMACEVAKREIHEKAENARIELGLAHGNTTEAQVRWRRSIRKLNRLRGKE